MVSPEMDEHWPCEFVRVVVDDSTVDLVAEIEAELSKKPPRASTQMLRAIGDFVVDEVLPCLAAQCKYMVSPMGRNRYYYPSSRSESDRSETI